MALDLTMFAAMSDWFPWYTWVLAGLLIVLLIGYKVYQNKMMS